MSEYLSKKAVLEWLKEKQKKQEEYRNRLEIGHPYWEYHEGAYDYLSLAVEEFESGAFDADNTEIQRLRAALEEVRECLDDFWDRDTPRRLYKEVRRFAGQIHVMEKVINQALSTATEPTNAANVKRIDLGEEYLTVEE